MPKHISPDRLKEFCIAVLIKAGVGADDARVISDVLVMTDTWGTFSHGTARLASYVSTMRTGGISHSAKPEVINAAGSWAVIDGHSCMGMMSCCLAMDLAIEKARHNVLSWVGVRNSSHFGAAGYYANMAACHDMIGIAMSNADPNMVVPGGRGHIIGNNPFAYAVPAGSEHPPLLDMAMSAVAAGKILAMKAAGKSISPAWLTDAEGLPVSEVGDWPASGSMAPMAGHKGYGLAFWIEILAGVLTGAGLLSEVKSWIFQPTELSRLGQAFIVINVGQIMPIDTFKQRVDSVIRQIHAAPKAKGSDLIYVPGEIEWEKRQASLRNGIPLPDAGFASLYQVGEQLGVDTGLLD
jgi:LDH2 family malate/lactate/ureidoglycolate dehydrogenase